MNSCAITHPTHLGDHLKPGWCGQQIEMRGGQGRHGEERSGFYLFILLWVGGLCGGGWWFVCVCGGGFDDHLL